TITVDHGAAYTQNTSLSLNANQKLLVPNGSLTLSGNVIVNNGAILNKGVSGPFAWAPNRAMTISGGGQFNLDTVGGFATPGNNTVTVTGPNSLLNVSDSLGDINVTGSALNVTAGGRAAAGGSFRIEDGTILVDGAGSALATIADPLGADLQPAAAAVMTIAGEHMVAAIKELTIGQGIDPREAGLVAGGGAAGLGAAEIARALGCAKVLLPRTAGALSAFGGQHSDIALEAGRSVVTATDRWDAGAVDAAFAAIEEELAVHGDGLRARGIADQRIDRFVEARYAHQVWSLEIPVGPLASAAQIGAFAEAFHAMHQRVFAVSEPGQRVEVLHAKGRLTAVPAKPPVAPPVGGAADGAQPRTRQAYFAASGAVELSVYAGGSLPRGARLPGPLLVAEPTTTIVVPPNSTLVVTDLGNYLIEVT
ncbi:MAG: hydantoinase A/oxoprolinase protein, partial [Solirubrobacterales bacterium]|nr:hydantoinase A/oxoprolinase protein [Solirubrobacterales bacterium]